MWVVYQKKDLQVVGMSALCDPDFEKGAAVEEIVKGLVNPGAVKNYDAVQVKDFAQAASIMSAPQHVAISDDGKGKVQATVEVPQVSLIVLKSDGTDVHPVDGIPQVKADGISFTTITVQKIDQGGVAQKSSKDSDELHLRATEGTLQSPDGKEAITSIKLKQGQATFRLVSEKARRVATVTVFNGNPNLQDGSIRIEFI
jgi:hypothetical protein